MNPCAVALLLLFSVFSREAKANQEFQGQEGIQSSSESPDKLVKKRGLIRHDPGAEEGYTLIAPFGSKVAYLLDMEGKVVHQWMDERGIDNPYLQDNGDIVYCTELVPGGSKVFTSPGGHGLIRRIAWNSTLVWEIEYSNEKHHQHHDIALTPHGTVLMIAWELKTNWDALANGRDPKLIGNKALWPCHIVEFEPRPPNGAELIWEWHSWDHLIQDHDDEKANYGVVSDHPELIDINGDDVQNRISSEEYAQLQALGYVNDAVAAEQGQSSDWLHMNSIDYNADLGQILVSVPRFCEIWIIDHSTTFEEASGHEGGNSGRGGDLLFRWGNPRSYRMGGREAQVFEYQHDARWIPAGLPGEGRITVFNNGDSDMRGYSSIVELFLGPDENGLYPRAEGEPFGPGNPFWEFKADGFFSDFVSGAHRLPSGNTFICEGAHGRIMEVTNEGQVVWEYLNPFRDPMSDDSDSPYGLFRATKIPINHRALEGRGL